MIAIESCQALFIEMLFNGQQLATGTAFICAQNGHFALITNRHNFTCRSQVDNQPLYEHGGVPNKIRVWHHVKGHLGAFGPVIYDILGDEDEPLWIEHPLLGAQVDIGALKIEPLDDFTFFPIDSSEPKNRLRLQPAEIVSVIGYPFGLSGGISFATWATGFVATEPDVDYDDLPLMLVDARSRAGQSGAPVVAVRRGLYQTVNGNINAGSDVTEFLGIYSGRINVESDLGKVWKRSAVRCVLADLDGFMSGLKQINISARFNTNLENVWKQPS